MSRNERLERTAWDLFWLPDDTTVIDRPELLVVGSERPLSHVNCVYRTRAPAERLPALVQEVTEFHGKQSRWMVADAVDPGPLETVLTASGYVGGFEHDARIVTIDEFRPRTSTNVTVRRVSDEESLRHCWHVTDRAFDRTVDRTEADVAQELSQCSSADARVQRFVAYRGDEPAASGGLNLFPDLSMGFLWAGGTVPEARGQGVYSALVAARIDHARTRGITFAGVYAKVDTSSPIIAAQGFERCGRMTYWDRSS